jgi:hypothetical protein
MALPHSMDYLMNGGVLDFDAAAYLNSSATGVQYPSMLGGVQMQNQPKNDSFTSKAKAKLTDTNFLKKAATAAIVTTLAVVGFCKGKKCWNSVKSSEFGQSVSNFFAKFKK